LRFKDIQAAHRVMEADEVNGNHVVGLGRSVPGMVKLTAGLIEVWTDESEARSWFLTEIKRDL
jgi:hypothetical protein